MTKPVPVTVLIATRNEAVNLPTCLAALHEFERVVVIDSGSTDQTAAIAREFGAEVIDFRYEGGYPKKRQWALDTLDISTGWTLLLDADEVAPPEFLDELQSVICSNNAHDGYLVTKAFHFMGRKFRFGGFSHAAILLFRTGQAKFEHLLDEAGNVLDMEVHERLIVDGTVGQLGTPLIHEDFRGLEAYIDRHNQYSTWEAKVRFQHLTEGFWGRDSIRPDLFGNVQERRRFLKQIAIRLPFEPWLWFFYHFVLRLGFLEGRPGLIASQIRSSYIAQARAKYHELRTSQHSPDVMTLPFVRERASRSEPDQPSSASKRAA